MSPHARSHAVAVLGRGGFRNAGRTQRSHARDDADATLPVAQSLRHSRTRAVHMLPLGNKYVAQLGD